MPKIRKHIEVNEDDFEWYVRTHSPEEGFKTGFSPLMSLLLRSYREVCDQKNSSLSDLTREAAKHVQEEIQGQGKDREHEDLEGISEFESGLSD